MNFGGKIEVCDNSPFPAEPGMSPVIQDVQLFAAASASGAVVTTVAPRAHLQRSFRIDNLRLGDAQARPGALR